ncbi:type II toxin-antitoxin system PemK/MazF family toxin [Desulfovibrio sp. OttesenSCG-928-M14]|nr:type II toxin-antitoxin system PemK/MazF family toxin [Desulfovibrio sp. OttesenSCG-928-M14]
MTPNKGDILHIDFDPASGHETKGEHFCLVVSSGKFNKRFRLAMVCPISSGNYEIAKASGMLVPLSGFGLNLYGNIHIHQLTTIDYKSRNAKFHSKAPRELLKEVILRQMPILEED